MLKQSSFFEKCKCGLLNRDAKVGDGLISLDEKNNVYYLQLNEQLFQEIQYCKDCGGNSINQVYFDHYTDVEIAACKCGLYDEWMHNPEIALAKDDFHNLYYLSPNEEQTSLLLYCIACGRPATKGHFNEKIVKPSDKEVDDFLKKIEAIQTVDDALRLFGEPHSTSRPNTNFYTSNTTSTPTIENYLFYNLYTTFNLIVFEYSDGNANYIVHFKSEMN